MEVTPLIYTVDNVLIFFWLDPLCASPCRAVMQHLGGSWDKRHVMRFYVLHVALGLRSASYVQGTYEDYEHTPDT